MAHRPSPLKLSVVIVNWNTRDFLDACLRSLRDSAAGLSRAVCVVDNASEDGSVAMVRQKHPDVQCIVNPQNDGFAKACNVGLKAVSASDYVLFLNPDTVVLERSIQGLIGYLEDHPDVGAATGSLLDEKGRFQEAQGNRFPSIGTAFNQYLFVNRLLPQRFFQGIYWTRPPSRAQEVDWISGAAMMVRRAAMPEGPFFDESYFMYAEDMEASLALRRRGWKLMFLPDVKLVHHVKKATRQSSSEVRRSPVSSQLLFLKRHRTPWQFAWIRTFIGLGFYLRYAAYAVLSGISSDPAYDEKASNHRQYLTCLGLGRPS